MSSWKSIIAGRENDVYFLLKELVEDREIAKAIGDFKGVSGPNKKQEDERSLKERLKDFSKGRVEQREKIERAFELLEKAVKENDSKDASEYIKELFVSKEGLTQFDKEIYESIKNAMDTKKYETNIDVSDKDKEILANYGRQTVRDFIEEQIESSLGLIEPKEVDYEQKIKEREAEYKNARDNAKEEGKKLDKQIKFMESVLGGKKVRLSEVAEVLELPMRIRNVSLEQRRELQDDIQRRENRLKSIKLEIKRAKKEVKNIQDFFREDKKGKGLGRKGPKASQKLRREQRDKRIKLEVTLKKLNKELKEIKPNEIEKDKKELNALKLESQKSMKLETIQNEKGFKNELKSLKRKKQGLSSKEEVAKNRLFNATVAIVGNAVTEEERRDIFESLEEYGKSMPKDDDGKIITDTIKEVQNLSKNELNRKIRDSKLKIIASDKKSALESFDETTELVKVRIENIFSQKEKDKLIAEGKEQRPQAKESVAFSEIFSEIEGKPALKTIKELLNEEGFKQYLSILDKKIVIEGEKIGAYKKMTAKQKNNFILDNMPKFKEYYTRLMRALDDLVPETPTKDKKIAKIKKLMGSMQSRFIMTKKEKEKRKKSPIRYGAYRTADFEGKSKAGIKQVVKEQLAEEEKMLYGYFFERARVDSAKKQEALLTSDVGAQTRKFWTELSSNMDAFSKAALNYQNEDDFVKAIQSFIGKNNLHVIDILNLMGTKRNNKIRSDILTSIQSNKLYQDLTRAKKEAPTRYKKETLEQKIARQKREGKQEKKIPKKYEPDKRYEPKDPRFPEKESMLKSEKESDEKVIDSIKWGKLKLEDAVKLANDIKAAKDSDDFDTSNKRLHTFFTKEKGKEDKNRFFAFVDVNRKAEVVVRGFSYKKGDKGYNEIEKAADSILKNLEKEVTFEGQKMTILEVINRISRNTFKYKAGRVDSDTKDAVREQFGKLVEEAIKNVKTKKSEQFRIPKFFKSRMKEDTKVFRNDLMRIFMPLKGRYEFGYNAITREYESLVEINEIIFLGSTKLQEIIFDVYEKINSMAKVEPKEKDIDTRAEEMTYAGSLYAKKNAQLKRLLNALKNFWENTDAKLDAKSKTLLDYERRMNEKIESLSQMEDMDSPKGKATRKVINIMKDFADRINEERKEYTDSRSREEHILMDKITKVREDITKEIAENKRLIEAMESGEGKRTKRGIKVPAKEEDE